MGSPHLTMADYTACFHNSVVIITGAGGFLGSGLAVQLARYGAKLGLLDIDQARLETCVRTCMSHGLPAENVVSSVCDVTNKDDADRAVKHIAATFGKIDVLMNIVGNKIMGKLESHTVEDMDSSWNANCRSTFNMCKSAQPYLLADKG